MTSRFNQALPEIIPAGLFYCSLQRRWILPGGGSVHLEMLVEPRAFIEAQRPADNVLDPLSYRLEQLAIRLAAGHGLQRVAEAHRGYVASLAERRPFDAVFGA